MDIKSIVREEANYKDLRFEPSISVAAFICNICSNYKIAIKLKSSDDICQILEWAYCQDGIEPEDEAYYNALDYGVKLYNLLKKVHELPFPDEEKIVELENRLRELDDIDGRGKYIRYGKHALNILFYQIKFV